MPTSKPQEAFDLQEQVSVHQDGLRRYLRYLRCPSDRVDDIVQEAFLSLLRSNERVEEIDDLGAWLRCAARHRYFDGLKTWRRGRLAEAQELDREWELVARDDAGETYLVYLRECMAELEKRSRRALHLQYAERRSRVEIGGDLDMTVAGVKSLLSRSKAALERCIRRKEAS